MLDCHGPLWTGIIAWSKTWYMPDRASPKKPVFVGLFSIRIFLSLADDSSVQIASALCGQDSKMKASYSVSVQTSRASRVAAHRVARRRDGQPPSPVSF